MWPQLMAREAELLGEVSDLQDQLDRASVVAKRGEREVARLQQEIARVRGKKP